MNTQNIFSLTKKRVLWIILLDIAAIILHNVVSASLGREEALFFTLAVFILPMYFSVAAFLTIINRSREH